MSSGWWKKVEDVYHAAREVSGAARSHLLDSACMGDSAMRRQIEVLLEQDESPGSFLNRPAIELVSAADSRPAIRDAMTIGQTVAHYRILEKLDSGGMGQVFRARDERLGRHVAVKFLHERAVEDPAAVDRFIREAQAASALNHPNIVTIHEIGEVGGVHFIVMELVEGRNLRAVINERLTVPAITHLGSQIARALAAAHRAGIVHRDIKPENIMVRDDGYVKVLDFGLARLMPTAAAPNAPTALTETGTVLGTIRYMSPEQVRGEAVDSATDVFALGLVLYEAVTGQHPFQSDWQIGFIQAILTDHPLSPSRLNPQLPQSLETLLLQTLAKDPHLRPSASGIDAALTELGNTASTAPLIRGQVPSKRHIVGRDMERGDLYSGLQTVLSGRGLMLCVSGEAGEGKTTFVEDFLAELPASGYVCTVARGRCSERLAGNEAYLPFLEALENLLRGDASQSFGRAMKALAPSWYFQIAPAPEEDSATARAIEMKAGSQERMKRELAAFLQEVSRVRPVILFFDDLHWVDESTTDLMGYLAMRFDSVRTLILGAYRPSDLFLAKHPFLRLKLDLQARGACRDIPLEFLTLEDVERYVRLEFPDHDFPLQFGPFVHERTEGSPLFMVDLLRYFRDRGVIALESGRWRLREALPEIERDMPASVRSLIQRKIDQLGAQGHRLLVAASVQGYEFDSAVVARAMAIDPSEVEEQLQELDRVHAFVRLTTQAELPDGGITLRYRFVHVLYQNSLYASLTPTRKTSLSRAVAQALLQFHGKRNPAVALELAVLFEAARDFGNASEYFMLAARHALLVFANSEAAALARRGLESLEKARNLNDAGQRELALLGTLGWAVAATRGYAFPELEETYTRVRAQLPNVDQVPEIFLTLWGLWAYDMVRGDCHAAVDSGQCLLQLARKVQDPALISVGHYAVGAALKFLGDFGPAMEHCDQGIVSSSQSEYSPMRLFGWDGEVLSRSTKAEALWIVGLPDQALECAQKAVARAQELAHAHSMLMGCFNAALVHYHRREMQEARAHAEILLRLSGEERQPDFVGWASIVRTATLGGSEPHEHAINDIRDSLASLRAMGSVLGRPFFLTVMAKELEKAGRRDEGLSVLDQALNAVNRGDSQQYDAEVYRLKGELLLRQGRLTDAEACFHQAVAVARRQGAKSFELRALTSLARLSESVRPMLAAVYSSFTEGLDTADLKEAKALLDQVG